MVIDVVLSIEMVWFVNFGMEVCMGMFCFVCVYIGCEKIFKFEGCYYGYVDFFLVKVGSGVVILGFLDFFGVFFFLMVFILMVFYNDLEVVKEIFVIYKGEIVVCVLEFVVGNFGFIIFYKEFL